MEIRNAIFEINNTLERIITRLDETEYHISGLEDKIEKNTHVDQKKKNKNSKK